MMKPVRVVAPRIFGDDKESMENMSLEKSEDSLPRENGVVSSIRI